MKYGLKFSKSFLAKELAKKEQARRFYDT